MERILRAAALAAVLVMACALALYIGAGLGAAGDRPHHAVHARIDVSVARRLGHVRLPGVDRRATPPYTNQRYFLGYPEHLAKDLHATVVNPSCPGETSASLINAKAQSNGCENALHGAVGYRTLYPLHVKYRGSQLAFAVQLPAHASQGPPGFADDRLQRLLPLPVGDQGLVPVASEQKPVLARITRNVHTIVSAIRNRAHYRGQLVIVHYYSLNYGLGA